LDAIAFDKGCYTGQEVIARAHYRGRVKRRMQRFVTRAAPTSAAPTRNGPPGAASTGAALIGAASTHFAPGASGELADGRSFKVIGEVQLPDGRFEFLAVAPARAGERDETAPAAAATDAPAEQVRVDAEQLPLPYAVPD